MNTKSLLLATLATVFTSAVLADGKSPAELQQEAQLHAPSTTTRAAVLAEVLKARAAGTLNVHPDYGPHPTPVSGPSALTRGEVRAQLAQARANGTLNVHPDYGPHPTSVSGDSALTRTEVRAQLVKARANGTLDMHVESGGQ